MRYKNASEVETRNIHNTKRVFEGRCARLKGGNFECAKPRPGRQRSHLTDVRVNTKVLRYVCAWPSGTNVFLKMRFSSYCVAAHHSHARDRGAGGVRSISSFFLFPLQPRKHLNCADSCDFIFI